MNNLKNTLYIIFTFFVYLSLFSNEVKIETIDKKTITGKVIDENNKYVVVETKEALKVIIPRHKIIKISYIVRYKSSATLHLKKIPLNKC